MGDQREGNLLIRVALTAALVAAFSFAGTAEARPGCQTRACKARTCRSHECHARVAWKRITPADRAWLYRTRMCESHGNYRTNTGNGFYGAYQFDAGSWRRAGGSTAYAHLASRREQDLVALRWRRMVGTGAWPVCG